MGRNLKQALCKVKSKLHLCVVDIVSQAETNPESESVESNKVFYLLSILMFFSLILLAPDKIPQTFTTPSQSEINILERLQEIVKKFSPRIG